MLLGRGLPGLFGKEVTPGRGFFVQGGKVRKVEVPQVDQWVSMPVGKSTHCWLRRYVLFWNMLEKLLNICFFSIGDGKAKTLKVEGSL